jgi:predicted dehydrogenase
LIWVAYYRRALPRFVKIRQLLEAGVLGRPLSVHTTWRKPTDFTGWRWDPERNRGGEFYETACHTLDVLDLLLGPATDVAGVVTRDGHAVSASYRFFDVVGSGSWAFGTPDVLDETVVTGTGGILSFASFAPTPIRLVTAHATDWSPPMLRKCSRSPILSMSTGRWSPRFWTSCAAWGPAPAQARAPYAPAR